MSSVDNQVASPTNEENEAYLEAMLSGLSFSYPMFLNAAIEMDLFSIIAKAGPGAHVSASEVASQLPAQNPDAASRLDRLMRLLSSYSLLSCSLRTLEDGSVEKLYGLTAVSKFLVQGSDEASFFSLLPFCRHQAVLQTWLRMKDYILEGGDLFEKVHGISVYQYMNNDPTSKNNFHRSMAAVSQAAMKGILDVYRGYEGLASLIDVGGGTGQSLNMIISKYPSIKGINFDLPHVIQSAPSYPGIEHVGGDMFSGIPTAEALMLKAVFHNWDDQSCIKLMKNCYEALPTKGKLIIITTLLPEKVDSSKASVLVSELDNFMAILHAGKERTAKEYEALCKTAGFSSFQLVCVVYDIWAVIESYK